MSYNVITSCAVHMLHLFEVRKHEIAITDQFLFCRKQTPRLKYREKNERHKLKFSLYVPQPAVISPHICHSIKRYPLTRVFVYAMACEDISPFLL